MAMMKVYLGDYEFEVHPGFEGYYPDMIRIRDIMKENPTSW